MKKIINQKYYWNAPLFVLTIVTVGLYYYNLDQQVAKNESKQRSLIKEKDRKMVTRDNLEHVATIKNEIESPRKTFHITSDLEKTTAFTQLAIRDIDEALREAASETDVKKRSQLYGIIARIWAKINPEECFKWAESLGLPEEKQTVLIHLLQATASDGDAQKALKLFDKIPKGQLKDAVLVFSFTHIASSDREGAIKRTEDLAGSGAIRAVASILAERLVSEGRMSEIAETWAGLKSGEFKDLFGLALVSSLSKESPTAALDWIVTNSDKRVIGDSTRLAAQGFVSKDPNLGIQLSEGITDPFTRNLFQDKLGHEWGHKDPVSASNWLLTISSSGDYARYSNLAKAIVEEWVNWDHGAALHRIALLEQGETKDALNLVAANQLSSLDPARGTQMLFSILDGNSGKGQKEVEKATSIWMNRDPDAATDWIGRQNSGPLKDAAINSIVSDILLTGLDYDIAISWAAEASDANLRHELINRIQKKNSAK